MPVMLTSELWFPSVENASKEGLVAIGGDLSPERLLLSYARGIFPWYSKNEPILWWSPDPRCILPLDGLIVPRRLQRKYKSNAFHCTINTDFASVIDHCACVPRPGQDGTWILPEMRQAYMRLHHLGFAHSVECWKGDALVGGVYGVALGKAFFGESMFHCMPDASKIALLYLVEQLQAHSFTLFDCQQETPHMLRMGAQSVSRRTFAVLLEKALQHEEAAGQQIQLHTVLRPLARAAGC